MRSEIELTPRQVIERIAQVADSVSWQAGVGGMEIAGTIISVLAKHPDMIEAFMRDGAGAMIDGDYGLERGCLTFHRKDGTVTTPSQLSAARHVHKMKRAAKSAKP